MSQKTMIQAITDALDLELANDDKTLVFGEDVGKMVACSGQLMACKRSTVRIVFLTRL